MPQHTLRVHPSADDLPRQEQLAWKLAELATADAPRDPAAVAMVANRVIDNAGVAIAAIDRSPVVAAREQALAHPRKDGSCVMGVSGDIRVDPEWAAWANGVAVRELDMHDTYLAADYSHPADNLPPLIAVAQRCGRSGADLVRAALVAYEVQISLVRSICLHQHKKDHVAHLGPAQAAGIGSLLGLSTEVVYQAIQHMVHVSFATRQSRKGEISSWKAYAPAHVGKLAIEAVDRAMRGQGSPSPIYEGEDSVVAYMLDGKDARYTVDLPDPEEPRRAILDSYTKEHSAEYQAQAFIDLAFRLRERVSDWGDVERVMISTSHHTHNVIGTGANDPQKFDPAASRETLDHSLMYILAVALQDGRWSHIDSYLPERASRPDTVELWRKIETREDPLWTNRYHDPDPNKRAFGGGVSIELASGEVIEDELSVANAHPAGATAWGRENYLRKFDDLTGNRIDRKERVRFVDLCERLEGLAPEEINGLNTKTADPIVTAPPQTQGIF